MERASARVMLLCAASVTGAPTWSPASRSGVLSLRPLGLGEPFAWSPRPPPRPLPCRCVRSPSRSKADRGHHQNHGRPRRDDRSLRIPTPSSNDHRTVCLSVDQVESAMTRGYMRGDGGFGSRRMNQMCGPPSGASSSTTVGSRSPRSRPRSWRWTSQARRRRRRGPRAPGRRASARSRCLALPLRRHADVAQVAQRLLRLVLPTQPQNAAWWSA